MVVIDVKISNALHTMNSPIVYCNLIRICSARVHTLPEANKNSRLYSHFLHYSTVLYWLIHVISYCTIT